MGWTQLVLLASAVLALSSKGSAECLIRNSGGTPVQGLQDPVAGVLGQLQACPLNVIEFKAALGSAGLKTKPYLVSNRGFHNRAGGSFSFFEEVRGRMPNFRAEVGAGEFYFGHFTTLRQGQVGLDQTPNKGKLMIELIAWDRSKQLFNFYELIGTGAGAQWFYRGDSKDILADNAALYLDSRGPKFGSRLRCSACHTSGGPIMKELNFPHNDWWTKSRPLPLSPNAPSIEVQKIMANIGDASDFSGAVRDGMSRLEASGRYQSLKKQLPLQTLLRPLFCEVEINLESDLRPLDGSSATIQVPSASLVNSFLGTMPIAIEKQKYSSLLGAWRMRFPEISRQDADHGWLTPVKGHSDILAIESLVKGGVVPAEFVADVLAVDFKNPVLSKKRCALLKLVPSSGGLGRFVDVLRAAGSEEAIELSQNLTEPSRNFQFHKMQALAYLREVQASFTQAGGGAKEFEKLLATRQAVFDGEISQNPLGQILEPGFRVIFPQPR